jgi:hypothetical protein
VGASELVSLPTALCLSQSRADLHASHGLGLEVHLKVFSLEVLLMECC